MSDLQSPHLLSLNVKRYEILVAYPLQNVPLPNKKITAHIAVLGLLDKMTGAAAVLRSNIRNGDNGMLVHISLKAMGQLGI